MAVRIQFRRDTAINWVNGNPLLANGELGLETDTKKFKIGDGSALWNDLSYGGMVGPKGDAGAGFPAGGTTLQVLQKQSSSDFDTDWASLAAAETAFSPTTPLDWAANPTNVQAALDLLAVNHRNVVAKSTDYTLLVTDRTVISDASGPVNFTLPAGYDGLEFKIKRRGAGVVTVIGNIDGGNAVLNSSLGMDAITIIFQGGVYNLWQ